MRADDNSVIMLDAGTGIRNLGRTLPGTTKRVDVLLSHLHYTIDLVGAYAVALALYAVREGWPIPARPR